MTGIVYLINNEPEKGEAGLVEGVQQTVNCSMEQDVKWVGSIQMNVELTGWVSQIVIIWEMLMPETHYTLYTLSSIIQSTEIHDGISM